MMRAISLHAGALALGERGIEGRGVKVFGALKVAPRFTRPMIEKRRGSVINIVSGGILHFSHGGGYTDLRPNSREIPYVASKAALATMSFYMADELKPMNVAVSIIIPGHTRGSWLWVSGRAVVTSGNGRLWQSAVESEAPSRSR